MVSITTPFKGGKVEGLNVAEKLGYDGSFRYVTRDIDLWHFHTSLPANKAHMGNFSLDSNVSLSSNLVLPGSQKVYIPEILFDMVLHPDYRQHMEVQKHGRDGWSAYDRLYSTNIL